MIELSKLDNMFHCVGINLNDTFTYACGDQENMDWDDFILLLPLIDEHGYDITTAYASLIRGRDPIPPLVTDKFKECKKLLLQKLREDDDFMIDHRDDILK